MAELTDKVKDYKVVVRAGVGRESDDNIFRYIVPSINPSLDRLIENQSYRKTCQIALKSATGIVRETSKNITLTYSVSFDD